MLEPLVADFDLYQELMGSVNRLRACREALRPWFASIKLELLDRRLESLNEEMKRHESAIEKMTEQKRSQKERERELRRTIA